MQEEKNMEQPENNSQEQVVETKEDIGSQGITSGSIEKFKDSEALVKAYDSLQKEFTKKCQALSKLQKEYDDNKVNVALPAYHKQDWHDKVDEFMLQNPNAKNFSQQISSLIMSDKEIANSDNSLEKAWVKILKENYKTPKNLSEDENFVNEYILNNKNIKTKIIKQYLENLEYDNVPSLISKHNGTSSILSPPVKARSLEEANEMARALFKN